MEYLTIYRFRDYNYTDVIKSKNPNRPILICAENKVQFVFVSISRNDFVCILI